MSRPSTIIIGAGTAGVACVNVFAVESIATTVYERAGGVGGWLTTTALSESAPAYAFDHGA